MTLLNFYNNPDVYSRLVGPGVNDDLSLGYKIGDTWVNSSLQTIYFAADVTPGSAVWKGPF